MPTSAGSYLFDVASPASAFVVAKANAPIGGAFYHTPAPLNYQEYRNSPLGVIASDNNPAAVYGFTTSFNLFAFVYFMAQGAPARSTEILVTFAYDLVRNLRLFGAAAAVSVFIFVVVLIVFLITNRITGATESYTA